MKKLFSIIALLALTAISRESFAQNAAQPQVEVAPKRARPTYYDNHPEMWAAMQSLREAIVHLKKAGGGKGGHRAKAMKNIREAMREVRKGVEFANNKLSPEEKRKMQAELKADEKEIEAMMAE